MPIFLFVMGKIENILKEAKNKLKSADISVKDAEFLLSNVLGCSVSQLYTVNTITDAQIEKFEYLIDKRLEHYSMDRLIGYTEFLGIKIPYNVHTLSPRQETEIMTDDIIKSIKKNYSEKIKVLDLCTGSGCIGLAVAHSTGADVTMSDISIDALDCAETCAIANNIDVTILESNLFDNITGVFDIIISNPPYIATSEIDGLEPEVLYDDPMLALDGGDDGLDFYRRIINLAPRFLNPKGKLYLEIGCLQAKSVTGMLKKEFGNIIVHRDYAGLDRYIEAEKL